MRKIDWNLLLDGKNRRFYLCDQTEDFFGLPRRKLPYRRDRLSHRRAPASRKSYDQGYELDCDQGRRSELNQREYREAQGISLKALGNWRAKFLKQSRSRRRAMPHGALARTPRPQRTPRQGFVRHLALLTYTNCGENRSRPRPRRTSV
jgi:hypothetical protein